MFDAHIDTIVQEWNYNEDREVKRANVSDEIVLTVVTPVSLMAGRLENLESWLEVAKYLPVQVILVHDKQDDATGLELKELVNKLSSENIKLIEGFYFSPGLARNEGIRIAKGEWICFWDSDDVPEIRTVVEILKAEKNTATECLVSSFKSVDELTGQTKITEVGFSLSKELSKSPGIWRFYFKRKSLGNITFTNLRMAEDQIFLAEFLSRSRVLLTKQVVTYTYYFGSKEHLTSNKTAKQDLSKATNLMLEVLKKENLSSKKIIMSMYIRQLISGLRYGNSKTKLVVLFTFTKLLKYKIRRFPYIFVKKSKVTGSNKKVESN